MQTKCIVGSEEEGTEVKGFAVSGGNPISVDLNQLGKSLHEVLLGDLREADSFRGVVDTACVLDGAEELDLTVCTAICLQTLEYLCTVMKYGCGGMERDGSEGHDACILPALACHVIHNEHVVGKILSEAEVLCGLLNGGCGFCDADIHNNFLSYSSIRS